jgi:hypothetical protein
MVKRAVFLALAAALLGLSCASLSSGAGAPPEERTEDPAEAVRESGRQFPEQGSVPEETVFIPAPFPGVLSVPGIGLVTGEARDLGSGLNDEDKARLAVSFAEAYMEGVFRGLPLTGVLGGDQVHGWPQSSPLAWAQNWRGSRGRYNSWGTPSLILALQGLSRSRVFPVQGDILDAYGQSSGLGGANGAAGYGAPCGNEFIHQGGLAQRFDFGLITVDAGGNFAFSAGDPPSMAGPVPESIGLFESGGFVDRIRNAFQTAWKAGLDEGLPLSEPDGPLLYINLADSPWVLPLDSVEDSENIQYGVPEEDLLSAFADFPAGNPGASPETPGNSGAPGRNSSLVVRGLYCQSFGEGGVLFILAEAFVELIQENSTTRLELPLRPVPVGSSFLEAFFSASRGRLPGAESLGPYALPAGRQNDAFVRTLFEGIALYGLPLAGPQPVKEGESFSEAQRFSRGWMRKTKANGRAGA